MSQLTTAQLLFEGTTEEFLRRKDEFKGQQIQVFAEPKPQETAENDELRFDPPLTEQTEEQLEALIKAGLNSSSGTKQREAIWREVERRYAESEEDYVDLPTPPNTVRDQAHVFELLDAGLASPRGTMTREEMWQEVERRLAERSKTA